MPPTMHTTGIRKSRLWRLALLLLLAACVLPTATGCRDSDALKEIVLDQNAALIDYDNPEKYYINDFASDQESDKVSSAEVSDERAESTKTQNLVIYSSTPNSEGYTSKKTQFSAFPDFTDIEASETVCFYYSDSVDAFPHAVTVEEEQQPPPPEQDEEIVLVQSDEATTQPDTPPSTSDQPAEAKSPDPGRSDTGGDEPESTTPDEDGGGPSTEPELADPVEDENGYDDGFTSSEGIGQDKAPTVSFRMSDRDAEIPQIDAVAAFGPYAVIVQMVGGDGALAATDATTLAQFGAAGVPTSAVAAWTGDGSNPADLINVKAIVESGAKAILVDDPEAYSRELSAERFEYLEENGIQWISLRNMASSGNIRANVQAVAAMLQGSTIAAYGSIAQQRAAEYDAFHTGMVTRAAGGLASDTVGGNKALQNNNDADGLDFIDNQPTYTLLIDFWDPNASVSSGGYTFAPGAAYASAGYATTPFSYYMQAGGAINNAAVLSTATDRGEMPVLQFSQTESWNAGMWANTAPDIDYLYGRGSLLNTNVDLASTTMLGKGLGSSAMPKIVVASGAIKDALVANSAIDGSLYHPYGFVGNETTYGAIGITYATAFGETSMWGCIGSEAITGQVGDANTCYPDGVISADDVLVNPQGYFCDWTQGTVESFLEAGWVGAAISGSYDYNQWLADVADFYSWAYGIGVDTNRIVNP